MEQTNHKIYVSPRARATRVMVEQGIAVQVSTHVYLHPDWEEVQTPIGTDTNVEGGDVYLY